MKYLNCPICGADNHDVLYIAKDYNMKVGDKYEISKCKECNFIFLNFLPDANKIKDFYPSNVYFDKTDLRLGNKLNILKKFTSARGKGRILDVGCGYPLFLNSLKKDGWEVKGLDLSENVARFALEDFGMKIDTEAITDISYPENYFDVITFWHSLEHIPDIKAVLSRIGGLLKKDGTLIVCVPNIDSIQARIFKDKWYHLDVPRHLYHFSKYSLEYMFNRSGFLVKDINYHLFVDTYFGWMMSILNLLNFNIVNRAAFTEKLKDKKWLISFIIKSIIVAPVMILSCLEELSPGGASITASFAKKNA